MDTGSLQSTSSGDGGGAITAGAGVTVTAADINTSSRFNSMPILQQSSNFFQPNPNPNSIYSLDSIWSRASNSNPVYNHDLHPHPQQDPYPDPNPVDDHNTNHEKLGVSTKNPKKRTRASRRAPTTVLTTDTTNFRQMVQEFTGIPAGPFSGSSSASGFGRRNDLYGGGIAVTPTMNPLRPSAQKIQLQQPLNLSNLQNQMFPIQSYSQGAVIQQVNASEGENQRSEALNLVMGSSSKRWRGQDENLMNFEGVNGNSQNVVVSSRCDGDGDGDQLLPGNEDDSWSF
ncbi:hypothetical protein QVD17_01247 [Tagetes erecta]|uniref:VQ domain-containing protein n=1 Tax=Tagetes erecta TaxID=13708 RepID=A0AAD8P6L2_TARER|nr:hypothetical protein QVD17_01247 [Tagetes erecta]